MLNYEQAGVSIQKADALTELIKQDVKSDNIGMFAGFYEHAAFPDYYLVGCTDGVGTKIIPLIEKNKIETIAVDLIAMNLNDMVCTGAKPLFFLDYFAVNKLDVDIASRFIKTLKQELSGYNCALLGGETAELSDLVTEGHFDVAGFAVGLVRKDRILSKKNVNEGDVIIGLKSSGPHSNGYTLIRKVLPGDEMDGALEPTYIYVNEILELCDKNLIKACANITGGGLTSNIQRVIPENLKFNIEKSKIPKQPVFERLLRLVGEQEAYKTFNMGVGMCVIASEDKISEITRICKKYEPFILGQIYQ